MRADLDVRGSESSEWWSVAEHDIHKIRRVPVSRGCIRALRCFPQDQQLLTSELNLQSSKVLFQVL